MNLLKCNECRNVFFAKRSLNEHLRTKHNYIIVPKKTFQNYQCKVCGNMFSQVYSMYKHMERFHQIQSGRPKSKKKLVCCFENCAGNFGNYKMYRDHLLKEHSLKVELYETEFSSFEDFEGWKNQVEEQSNTCYSLDTAPKVLHNGTIKKYYNCHRSYNYKPQGNNRKVKIGKACPSRMELSANENEDKSLSFTVKFYSTHCGHFCEDVGDNLSEVSDVVVTEIEPRFEGEDENVDDDLTADNIEDCVRTENVEDKDENVEDEDENVKVETTWDCLNLKLVELLGTSEFIRCRTCLSTEKTRTYIKVTNECTNDMTIYNAILWIMPELKVKITEYDQVCNDCLVNLKEAISFVNKCLESDTILLQELEGIKKDNDSRSNENKTVENNDTDEEEEVYIDSNILIVEDDSKNKSDKIPTITDEVKYWNRCSKYFQDQMYRTKKPLSIIDKVELENVDDVITVGSLETTDVSEFIATIRTNINVARHTNFEGAQKILLLGSKFYKKCPICEKLFNSEGAIYDHFEEDHKNISKIYLIKPVHLISNNDSLQCDLCHETFDSLKVKKKHAEMCTLLNCPYCNQMFLEVNFNAHMEVKHSEHFPFNCHKCNLDFRYYRLFNLHKCNFKNETNVKEENDKKRKIATTKKCWYCKESFPLELYYNHLEMNHMTSTCSTCGLKFLNKSALRNHEITHQKELCSHCGKLISKAYFHNHIQIKHSDNSNQDMYKCSLCPKSYNNNLNLKSHTRRAHSFTVCELCGIKIRTTYIKTHYINKHSGIKKFACDLCSKEFSRKDYLERHLGHVHNITNKYSEARTEERLKSGKRKRTMYIYSNEPLTCKFCLKTFKYVSALKWHIEKVHFKLTRYKCKYCNMSYVSNFLRKKHEKFHEESELQYRCNTCWKRFASFEELNEHESSSHNRKFQCYYCDKSFSRQFAFNAHLIDIHLEEDELLKEKENLLSESLSQYVPVFKQEQQSV